ncbi:uncharacterized protein LOC127811669 [Diospyros lotus]|uniref:uncharacterized protein LOC127811669 n=1 Tax=Diospyros lotus TaxID=55363 RepID=UPI002259B08E|nr:uncharacterized protein LOC127811669 [Diospyros lotus]
MESDIRTRKRKRNGPASISCGPFAGIFTRSRSQIYVHCHRSGRERADDPQSRLKLHSSQQPTTKRSRSLSRHHGQQQHDVSSDAANNSLASIKDLRARRVFSPASITEEGCGFSGGIADFDLGKQSKVKSSKLVESDLGFRCLSEDSSSENRSLQPEIGHCYADGASEGGGEPVQNGPNYKLKEGINCREEGVDLANPNLSEKRGEGGVCDAEQRDDNGRVLSLTEECIHTTPVDAVISNGKSIDDSRPSENKNWSISNGTVCPKDDCWLGISGSVMRRKGSIPRNKMVLNSCSRRQKVFKTPGSFSFRRLLPFLTEIAKDDPCVSMIEKRTLGVSCKDPSLNGAEDKYSLIMGKCKDEDGGNSQLLNMGHGSNEDGHLSNGVGELTADNVQMTPPDVDIFSKPEIIEKSENEEDIDLKANVHTFRKSMESSSSIKSKPILNSFSRKKVFKAPGSFSYRRLLPFLNDIGNDSDNSIGASKCTPKVESNPKEHLPVLASHLQEVPIDAPTTDGSSMEYHTGDSGLIPPAEKLTSSNGSFDNEVMLKSAENIIEPEMPFDSQKECITETEQVTLLNSRNGEPATSGDIPSNPEMESTIKPLYVPCNCETLDGDGTLDFSHCVSIATQEFHTVLQREHSKNQQALESENLHQNSSKLEGSISSGIPSDGLMKGILRRNPRGCRGLCNCLNCASFRLHADRAFEFSRNQMQDAEEIALELIQELSYLRNMLEKSTVDATGHAIVHVNQVKEASTRALNAQELAKDRLGQMNLDLSIHSRSMLLQRPRVKFANYVEEVVISKADLQMVEKNEKVDSRKFAE